MNIYFIIYLIINVLGLGTVLSKHGQKQDGKHNFFASLISMLLCFWLIYKGVNF